MTLPNDSIAVTPGAGAAMPTHLISGKEYPVGLEADMDGHIKGSLPAYLLTQTPRVTTAAATDFFDIFNAAGSGYVMRIRGLWLIKNVTAASAIIPFFEFHAFRTSAVGTAGTAHTFDSATAPAAGAVNIARMDTTAVALPAQVTARSLPTGGATAAQYLFPMYFSNEETYTFAEGSQFYNLIPDLPYDQPLEIQEGQGFKVRQITATASTGTNYGWMLAFVLVG
jgi:hypothetical protein